MAVVCARRRGELAADDTSPAEVAVQAVQRSSSLVGVGYDTRRYPTSGEDARYAPILRVMVDVRRRFGCFPLLLPFSSRMLVTPLTISSFSAWQSTWKAGRTR